jgi:hypothetical protein
MTRAIELFNHYSTSGNIMNGTVHWFFAYTGAFVKTITWYFNLSKLRCSGLYACPLLLSMCALTELAKHSRVFMALMAYHVSNDACSCFCI